MTEVTEGVTDGIALVEDGIEAAPTADEAMTGTCAMQPGMPAHVAGPVPSCAATAGPSTGTLPPQCSAATGRA